MINEREAKKIAAADAGQAYRDLSPYRISARLEGGNWHIDYELKNTKSTGGGPHYIISAKSGKIVSRRFEQ